MKFAHFADCHLGGWREPRMQALNFTAFSKIITEIITENVDFVVLSGDLFNTSLPSIEIIKETVVQLKRLKDKKIKVYAIAGSHDFSPSGKTMLDVLEKAELLINVAKGTEKKGLLTLKFTIDEKTGVKLTGLPGKKGMLEKLSYQKLDLNSLENETGNKIFLFHTAISEYLPENMKMDSVRVSFLPKNFNYYAGGHVHSRFSNYVNNYGLITMPGPGFPNNFKELEELKFGGFWLVEGENKLKAEFHPVKVKEIFNININCDNKSAEQIASELEEQIKNNELDEKIVLIRIHGTLSIGKMININFKTIYDKAYSKGAYYIMRNTNGVTTKEMEVKKIDVDDIENIEEDFINEKKSEFNLFKNEKLFAKELLNLLDKEQQIGAETKSTFEDRIISDFELLLKNNKH